jgi:Mn2+/Fe2+ NRAMP family transporter
MPSTTRNGENQPLLRAQNGATVNPYGSALDPSSVVTWDGPEDEENPRNRTTKSKTAIIAIVTAITVLSSTPTVTF